LTTKIFYKIFLANNTEL